MKFLSKRSCTQIKLQPSSSHVEHVKHINRDDNMLTGAQPQCEYVGSRATELCALSECMGSVLLLPLSILQSLFHTNCSNTRNTLHMFVCSYSAHLLVLGHSLHLISSTFVFILFLLWPSFPTFAWSKSSFFFSSTSPQLFHHFFFLTLH